MNQIVKQAFLEAGNLDAVSYFQFLVQEGCRLSLIQPHELETLQYQIVGLLTDRFNRWTGGQSSSVPVETGQRIQQSAFYTIGYYLKSLHDAESALEELKNHTLVDLFRKGQVRVEAAKVEAEELLHYVQKNCFTTDVLSYNETLKELSVFFSSYDMDFEAHGTPACLDYPLSNDNMNLTGIEYIYEYLVKLRMENEFCSCFSVEEIHALLRGFDRQYKELLFNIYDLLLTNLIGGMLLGRNDPILSISEPDRCYLQKTLEPLSHAELGKLVDEAVSGLCVMLSITNHRLTGYIMASAVNLKSRLKHALEVGGLHHLFLSQEDKPEEPAIFFEDKEMLDQDSFRKLADDIRECRFLPDKLALLLEKSPGMADLIDLLEGDCFFGEEHVEMFSSLGNIQLALLTKKLPLAPDDGSFLEEENDQDWKSSFYSWLLQLDPARRTAIMALAERIG